MHRVKVTVLRVCLLALTTSLQGQQTTDAPSVINNRIISLVNPAVTIAVDKQIKYLGKIDFPLKNIVRVQRFIFVDADETRHIQRMFIAQFEGFLSGVDDIYRYRIENPINLGGADYRHNIWFYDVAKAGKEEPEAEAARTRAFVESRGYHLDDQLMMSRFARPVDVAKRHELILFYWENLADTHQPLDVLTRNEQENPEAKRVAKGLRRRSLRTFTATARAPAAN